jgi:hypothetical protein
MSLWRRVRQAWSWVLRGFWVLTVMVASSGSAFRAQEPSDFVRRYTRSIEFDFISWTLDALAVKLGQAALGSTSYLSGAERNALVLEYARLVDQAARLDGQLLEIYADPSAGDQEAAAAPVRAEWEAVRHRLQALLPAAEAVLQEQVAVALQEIGLDVGGAPFPPVSFHFTRLPVALIVSPRTVIRQDANIQLETDLSLAMRSALENEVERALDVSALVVPVGGIGTYPTMVQESSALSWVVEVVAHEWTHNYLTLRPLGLGYDLSAELRTMNETAASLMGKEIGRRVLERYYPDLLPPPPSASPTPAQPPSEPPPFDFRDEMHTTRVTVDALLAEGKVEEAEAYMESQRQVFWDNGYPIRRLNQAYFAFHGAYADEPGGPAGEDPVGAAVRELWACSASPSTFLRRIAWMDELDDLLAALQELDGCVGATATRSSQPAGR